MPNDSLLPSHIVRLFILATAAVMLCSCIFDSGDSWRSGRFEIGWIDTRANSELLYRLDASGSIAIVEACVFAAGANDQFIVVKQRPASDPSIVNFYVVPKAGFDALNRQDQLMGPLSESAYHALAQRLSLPSIEDVVSTYTCTGR